MQFKQQFGGNVGPEDAVVAGAQGEIPARMLRFSADDGQSVHGGAEGARIVVFGRQAPDPGEHVLEMGFQLAIPLGSQIGHGKNAADASAAVDEGAGPGRR